jgi:hypothetical protein
MNCWNEPTNYQALRDLGGKNSCTLTHYIEPELDRQKRSEYSSI